MVGESCDVFAIQVLVAHACSIMCENPSTYSFICQGTYLSRPEDSERTFLIFESSCHLLLPF